MTTEERKDLLGDSVDSDVQRLGHVSSTATATFKIGGMTCGSCVETIERMLRQQQGIHAVTVALLAERAVVEFENELWTAEKIAEEIDDIGFEAEVIPESRHDQQSFKVYGMTCASCVAAVEQGLMTMDGVTSCAVSLATEEARVEFEKEKVGVRDIVERIEELGFDAVLGDDTDKTQLDSLSRIREVAEWRRAFYTSLAFAVPNFFVNMILPRFALTRSALAWQPITNVYLSDVISLCLATPVQFGIGKRFYITTFKALRHYTATMDVLIVLGTTASYSYSVFAMLFALFCTAQCARPSTSFETSTMLITFVTFGRYLENTAKGKTSEALSKLIGLAPSQAVIYTDGEKMTQERKVASDLIQRGDYVKVIPGERIAADGLVIRGSSSVDESMITGEALPVFKVAGSAVIGGTVNTLGTFDFVVTRAGKETSLSQIVRLVSDAQTSKAPIQAFADRVAGIFVPSVVLLGAFTFIFWMCISHALQIPSLPEIFQQQGASKLMVCLKLCISVVVVACPCALGLSTPTAVMVGTGVGAQNGILIKGGGPLEASRSITHILFDKTGTLTQGRLSVAAMCWHDGEVEDLLRKPGSEEATVMRQRSGLDDKACVSGLTRAQVLEVIGAAERKSEHPLARSIQMFIDSNVGTMSDVSVNTFESVLGQGIRSSVTLMGTKHAVAIGNAAFVAKQQASVLQPVQAFVGQEESQGRTAVYAIIDGSLACAFSLSDQLKPEARQAIDGLRRMGIHCAMVTGDSRSTAMAIATALDIEQTDVHAEMSPMGKREIVSRLRQQNALSRGGVAFVGDGINDSPALAAASLGIAVASGAEIAMEAASIVLMRSNLLDVPASLHLSRRIFRQIKLNFVWATAYNVLFIPLAMGFGLPWGLHLHPMMAGAAMAFSSVSVVLSSLTLKLWRRPSWLTGHDETTKTAYSVGNLFSNWFASARPTKALRQGYESVPMETV